MSWNDLKLTTTAHIIAQGPGKTVNSTELFILWIVSSKTRRRVILLHYTCQKYVVVLRRAWPVLFSTGWAGGSPTNIPQAEIYSSRVRAVSYFEPATNETITEQKGALLNQPYSTEYEQGTSMTTGTTHMKDDKETMEVNTGTLMSMYKRLVSRDRPDDQNDLATFFKKPIRIDTGTLAIADAVATRKTTITCPNDFIFSNALWDRKVDGLFGARFTMVFTMFINADRFQQGRYLLLWIPLGGGKGAGQVPDAWCNMRNRTLQSRTALPHVEIDVNTQTSVTLRVPFNSAYVAFPMSSRSDVNKLGALGRLELWPFDPLVTASGSASAGYSIWCHLEDFEPYGVAVPQSRSLDPSGQEQKSAGVGIISGPLMKVSKASNILSEFPLLSMYMQPVSWAAEIAARAAKVFGWSKPINLAAVTRVTNNQSFPYATNCDGIDNAMPMSMLSENKVSVLAGFSGTDEDELSILSFASRPAYIQKFVMSQDNAAGYDLLTGIPPLLINPANQILFFTTIGPPNIDSVSLTPLQFASTMFARWRGSIQFTFEIVKTEFHSGRIMVAYSPANNNSSATPTFTTTDYLYREIIDIRTCNSFTITVPFISMSPYKDTYYGDTNVGQLKIFVVDPLIAPDSVSQNITFLVKHSAGPDFELAVPQPQLFLTPLEGAVAQSVPFRTTEASPISSEIVNIGNSNIPGPTTDYAEATMGEKIVSFRAYLKRHCRFIASSAGALATDSALSFLPFAYPVRTVASPAPTLPDYITLFSTMFLYSRGGLQIKVLPQVPDTVDYLTATVLFQTYIPQGVIVSNPKVQGSTYSGYSGVVENGLAPFGPPTIFYQSKVGKNPEIEFSLPMYSNFINRLNVDCMFNTAIGYRTFANATNPKHGVSIIFDDHTGPAIAAPPCVISRAIADDGNFGCFSGIPVFEYKLLAANAGFT